MSEDDVEGSETDREKRIEALKRRAKELCGGEMIEGGCHQSASDVTEGSWNYVVAYEEAPWTTNFEQLERSGVILPHPEALGDQELMLKLGEVIERLADLRVFLSQTDHLSDRELYSFLWNVLLRDEVKALPVDENSAWHVDLCSSGSDEDNFRYLKYYADEETRQQWRQDFPDQVIPDHEDSPYDRDRFLPHPEVEDPEDLRLDSMG